MKAYITVDSIEIEKRPYKVKAKRKISILLEDLVIDDPIKELEFVVSELKKMIKEEKELKKSRIKTTNKG